MLNTAGFLAGLWRRLVSGVASAQTSKESAGMAALRLKAESGDATDPSSGLTRNTKSLRVTGINLRLLKNPNVSLNDLRKWCRTSIVQIQNFYDQAHPETSAARVAGRSGFSKTQ